MRNELANFNADLVAMSRKYMMQITGDNLEGKRHLDAFIDPNEIYPVIATTFKLMTTGVTAQTCKLIVLDSNIGSMTEFKQIIGLDPLSKLGSPVQTIRAFGVRPAYDAAIHELTDELYKIA